MSAHVLLNLFSEFWKSDECDRLPEHSMTLATSLINSIIQEH